jgi:hypothetical protein
MLRKLVVLVSLGLAGLVAGCGVHAHVGSVQAGASAGSR